jgi:hypothetical protein
MDEVGPFRLSTWNGEKVWIGERVWSGVKETHNKQNVCQGPNSIKCW